MRLPGFMAVLSVPTGVKTGGGCVLLLCTTTRVCAQKVPFHLTSNTVNFFFLSGTYTHYILSVWFREGGRGGVKPHNVWKGHHLKLFTNTPFQTGNMNHYSESVQRMTNAWVCVCVKGRGKERERSFSYSGLFVYQRKTKSKWVKILCANTAGICSVVHKTDHTPVSFIILS